MVEAVAAWKAQQHAAMSVQLRLEDESLARLEAAKAAGGDAGGERAALAGEGGDDPAWDAPGLTKVAAGFTANVWDIKVAPGDAVAKGDTLLVLEAMKMESPVLAPVAGVVRALPAEQGALAAAGQTLVVLEEEGAAPAPAAKEAAAPTLVAA